MYFYACPYCRPSKKSRLCKLKTATHEECDDEGNCEDVPSYSCEVCGEMFLGTEDFLKAQKRKIKDG